MKKIMSSIAKRSKLFLLIVLISLITTTTLAYAAFVDESGVGSGGEGIWDVDSRAWNAENWNLESHNAKSILDLTAGITAGIVGFPDANGNIITNNGALSATEDLVSFMLIKEPVSSKDYLAYLKSNIIGSPAYAQGAMTEFFPTQILDIWKVIRNVSYLFFTVIFIAIGLMIMFRTRLNPQVVVNIQNALPRIIIALVLVTFSFAICGFFVDIVFLSNKMLGVIFTGTITPWKDSTKIDILSLLAEGQWGGQGIFERTFNGLKGIIDMLGGDVSGVVQLIMAFTMLTTVFKIFFALLTRYVSIILQTIFSPISFLWGSLPGQSDHIGKFFKGFLVAALTFPVVFFLINLSSYLVTEAENLVNSGQELLKPLPPLKLSDAVTKNIASATLTQLVALGILMATAKAPDAIADALAVRPGPATETAGMAGALRRVPIIGSLLG